MDVMMVTPALYSGQFEGIGHFAQQFISWLLLGFSVPVVIAAWPSIFHRAYQAARRGAVGMETLISIGAGVALLYSLYETARGSGRSYFDTADMLLALVMTGKYIESNIRASAADAVSLLQRLMPRKAVSRHSRRTRADGRLVANRRGRHPPRPRRRSHRRRRRNRARCVGSVDESLLTGESRPVAKQPRRSRPRRLRPHRWLPGCPRHSHAPSSDRRNRFRNFIPRGTALHQIAALRPGIAFHRKTRPEQAADRISRVFVPLVLALAAICRPGGLLWPAPATTSFAAAMTRAVAVLVIACPCALGIATPMALLAAVAAAARRGILVSDPGSACSPPPA